MSVLFPFDLSRFCKAISNSGFMLPESAELAVPFGQRLEGRILARKADISIRADTERQIVGVIAPDIDDVIQEMDAVENLLRTELNFDSPGSAHYYEFLASLTVEANSNPLKNWHAHFAEVPILQELSKVLGEEVAPFGIRLAAREEVPNQANWLEFRIGPAVQFPASQHHVETIFRHTSRDKVFEFVRGFEKTVRSVVSLIDKG